jgi:hypothetical protein
MVDGVLQQLEVVGRTIMRTGTRTALVACYPCGAQVAGLDPEDLVAELTEVLPNLLREGDLVSRDDAGRLFVLLQGVQDLPNAIVVVGRLRDALTAAAPDGTWSSICFGVTLVSRGEGSQGLVDRAIGALMLAQGAGPGRIVSSPPL